MIDGYEIVNEKEELVSDLLETIPEENKKDLVKKLFENREAILDIKARLTEAKEIYHLDIRDQDTRLKVIRGEVFEQVVTHEMVKNSPVSLEILSLIEHPEWFALDKDLGKIKNPDITYIDIEPSGQIFIRGVGEAKLGRLNQRALNQLEEFSDNISTLVKFINETDADKLEESGLIELAKNKRNYEGNKMVMKGKDFTTTLIIPKNREERYKDLLAEDVFMNIRDFENFKKNINIKKSEFTIEEIRNITETMDSFIL